MVGDRQENPVHDQQLQTIWQWCADLVALEGEIEAALESQREVVRNCAGAAAAVQRFQMLAAGQRYALSEHLVSIGGGDVPARPGRARLAALFAPSASTTDTRLPVCTALWCDYTAFHHAAIGYGLLWGLAHRAYARRIHQPTFTLAEQHQHRYLEAAQEIVALSADVLLWELTQKGESCRCLCDSCDRLGLCICIGACRSITVDALAETAVPAEQGVLV